MANRPPARANGRRPMDDRPAAAAGGIGLFDAGRNGREAQAPLVHAAPAWVAGWLAPLLLAALMFATALTITVVIMPDLARWESSLREREAALAAAQERDAEHAARMAKAQKVLLQQQAEALFLQGKILKGARAVEMKLESSGGK